MKRQEVMARKPKKDVRTFSAFTQHGARNLALFYKSIGKKVLTNPTYNDATTLWQVDIHWNP